MERTSPSKALSQYLIDNFQVTIGKKGSVSVGEFSFTGQGQAGRFCTHFILKNKTVLKSVEESWLLLSDDQIKLEISNIFPTVKEYLESYVKSAERAELEEGVSLPTSREDYMALVPVVDMENVQGKAYIVDTRTHRITTIEEKAWEKIVGMKHVAQVRELAHCGRFEYNPRTIEAHWKAETAIGEETIYNKFIPPAHRMERDTSAVLSPDFIEFLEGLFLESCRSYAYNWIYHSTFKKLPVYLVLVGVGGIGKNLLAEALKQLHGRTNFTKAPASALESKFNGHLIDSTLVYYDECKFSSDKNGNNYRKNRLKEWANDYVPVEIKGVDAKDFDIYCSAIIATNHDSDVHLEQLDRKFSVLELSTERMEKRLGAEKTKNLWNYILEDSFPDAFLNWLEGRIDPDFNGNVEYRGPRFHELVLSSLSAWQQELLFNYILSGASATYSLKRLREEVSFFPTHYARVSDFLTNFQWEGETLGRIVIREGLRYVKVNDKFAPKEKSVMDLDKEL